MSNRTSDLVRPKLNFSLSPLPLPTLLLHSCSHLSWCHCQPAIAYHQPESYPGLRLPVTPLSNLLGSLLSPFRIYRESYHFHHFCLVQATITSHLEPHKKLPTDSVSTFASVTISSHHSFQSGPCRA